MVDLIIKKVPDCDLLERFCHVKSSKQDCFPKVILQRADQDKGQSLLNRLQRKQINLTRGIPWIKASTIKSFQTL